MAYKIAIASSDGKQIDKTFGAVKNFLIYEVTDGVFKKLEERTFQQKNDKDKITLPDSCNPSGGCGTKNDCGNGAGCGYGGADKASEKVELISDCRCIVCKKIGFHIQKQLERRAISAFDVSCSVEEALEKISHYFSRIDNHESFRAHNSWHG